MGFIPRMQAWYNIHKSINVTRHINKMKDKNHMIMSIDTHTKKHLIKFSMCLSTLSKMGLDGTYLNIITAIYGKPLPASYSTDKNYKHSP